jgi:hypothetical protein
MKVWENKKQYNSPVSVRIEDDGKGKDTSLDGHILIKDYVYGFSKEDVLNGVILSIDKIIAELNEAKKDLEKLNQD